MKRVERLERLVDRFVRYFDEAEQRREALGPLLRDARAVLPATKDECSVCGEAPTVARTGLCGPCCFGEAETVGGNW